MNYEERERHRRAYKEGRKAVRLGQTIDDCPKKYKAGGQTEAYWLRGFSDENEDFRINDYDS